MIDSSIAKFIESHHVMALSTVDSEGLPYSSALFYAFNPEKNILIFASDRDTAHACHFQKMNQVAFSIYLETRIVGKVKGLQGRGTVSPAEKDDRMTYLLRFPYAAMATLTLWKIEPSFLKLTDNKLLGFGKKLIWTI